MRHGSHVGGGTVVASDDARMPFLLSNLRAAAVRLVTCALAAIGLPAAAQGLQMVPLIGNGTATGQYLYSLSQWALNDFGTVAAGRYFGGTQQGIFVANGVNTIYTVLPSLDPPAPGGQIYPSSSLSLSNVNLLTFANSGVAGAAQVYENAFPATTATPASPILADAGLWALYTNSAGVSVLRWSDSPSGITTQHLSRLNGDGTATELQIPTGHNIQSASSRRPQILENGDIYILAPHTSNLTDVIFRYAAGETVPSIAYSTTDAIQAFDVNNAGDLVVAVNPRNGINFVQHVPFGESPVTIPGTEVTDSYYASALISDTGKVALHRAFLSFGSEVLYGAVSGGFTRVIGNGDMFNAGVVVAANGNNAAGTDMEMNSVGQLLLDLAYEVNEPYPYRTTLVRIDPPGTSPPNPVLPSCPGGGSGSFCLVIPWPRGAAARPGGASITRPWYFDPDYALGYRYVSDENPITGVEIPFAYGDGEFSLVVHNSATGQYVDSRIKVLSGQYFSFVEQLGTALSRFELRGIEAAAEVDPLDPRGFVTGLTFLDDAKGGTLYMTPLASALPPPPNAPVLTGMASRKAHGSAGTFDLSLAATTSSPTTEPRSGAAGVNHTIVFVFDKTVTSGVATVIAGTATAGTATFSGSEMVVPLTGVSNQQYVEVSVSDVGAADGGSGGSGSVRIGFLLGDVNQNRVVTVSDLAQVNAQIAQAVTSANFLKDVNASGTLTVADKGIANTQITKALPAP